MLPLAALPSPGPSEPCHDFIPVWRQLLGMRMRIFTPWSAEVPEGMWECFLFPLRTLAISHGHHLLSTVCQAVHWAFQAPLLPTHPFWVTDSLVRR